MGRTWDLSLNSKKLFEDPNWLDLPRDIMLMILMKLRAFKLLLFAQFVCKSWYNLCKDPYLWRTISVRGFYVPEYLIDYKKMLLNAVDRSDGCLTDLSIDNFCSNDILPYIASRSSQLKRLRLAYFGNLSAKAELAEAIVKLSSLVELELTFCSISQPETIAIIKSCPFLTTFKLNKDRHCSLMYERDEEALAIAGSMPELCHLQLIGNGMTNVGLTAILDGCPRLQSLDLRRCSHLILKGNLLNRLSEQIKDFRGPNDSKEDNIYVGGTKCNHTCYYCIPEYFSDGYSYGYSDGDYGSDGDYYYDDCYDIEDDKLGISYSSNYLSGFGNNNRGKLKKHNRRKNLKNNALDL